MELSTNPSGGPRQTKGHIDRKSSSLTSLFKPSPSSKKVTEFLVSNLETKVMFGNSFCFLFSKTCFWEYKEKNNFLVFLKSKTCLVS